MKQIPTINPPKDPLNITIEENLEGIATVLELHSMKSYALKASSAGVHFSELAASIRLCLVGLKEQIGSKEDLKENEIPDSTEARGIREDDEKDFQALILMNHNPEFIDGYRTGLLDERKRRYDQIDYLKHQIVNNWAERTKYFRKWSRVDAELKKCRELLDRAMDTVDSGGHFIPEYENLFTEYEAFKREAGE